jgi:hypothetical protein
MPKMGVKERVCHGDDEGGRIIFPRPYGVFVVGSRIFGVHAVRPCDVVPAFGSLVKCLCDGHGLLLFPCGGREEKSLILHGYLKMIVLDRALTEAVPAPVVHPGDLRETISLLASITERQLTAIERLPRRSRVFDSSYSKYCAIL